MIYSEFRYSMQLVQTKILVSFQRLEDAVKDVQQDLYEYALGNQLNEAFFM